jgi:hypothetical protein
MSPAARRWRGDGLDGALHAQDARVIIGQRQDLSGQPCQMLRGRQVSGVIWVLGCLALTPGSGTEQFLGEEADDRPRWYAA